MNELELKNDLVEMEMNFIPNLVRIENAGIPVNKEALEEILIKDIELYEELNMKFKNDYGDLNPNSPNQIIKYVKDTYGITLLSSTKDVLVQHSEIPLATDLIDYKHYKKESDLIQKYILEDVLHPTFNQVEASSGRMSSSNPNVQQVPRSVKEIFYRPREGKVILKADYPAIELRIAAVYAKDMEMIDAFKNGKDLHRKTASLLYKKSEEEITSEERQKAKCANFGLSYGSGVPAFIEKAKADGVFLTEDEANQIRKNFFKAYKGLKTWHSKTGQEFKKSGSIFVTTLFGRKILVDKYTLALNAPIQGTGADMLKDAVNRFYKQLDLEGVPANIINIVHDEIVVEVDESYEEKGTRILKNAMESACNDILKEFKTNVDIRKI